jgi:uncharacterized protein YcgL (UPF0745 family)
MGLFSWLFPTDEDRLARVRDLMAAGRYEKARSAAFRLKVPEAEALYDECCKHLEKDDRAKLKQQLSAQGFHGWKIEVNLPNERRRAELEKLIAEELAKAGVDLDLPDVDEKLIQAAVAKAQRRARKGNTVSGNVKLVRA